MSEIQESNLLFIFALQQFSSFMKRVTMIKSFKDVLDSINDKVNMIPPIVL